MQPKHIKRIKNNYQIWVSQRKQLASLKQVQLIRINYLNLINMIVFSIIDKIRRFLVYSFSIKFSQIRPIAKIYQNIPKYTKDQESLIQLICSNAVQL